MKCGKCGLNKANVYIEHDINGNREIMHLCAECASVYNMNYAINEVLQSFVNSFKAFGPDLAKGANVDKVCPKCSMTYGQLKRKGLLGCAGCYEVFENELAGVFANIQPGIKHTGKIPHKFGTVYLHGRELDNLKESLKNAVENEEYEEAARLRDIIKSMEEEDYVK